MENTYLLWAVVIAAAVTIAVRSAPFIVFGNRTKVPTLIQSLGAVLPAAVMATLLVYCLRHVGSGEVHTWIGSLIAVVFTAAIHLWRRNVLASIVAGTVLYMILTHFNLA